MVPSYLFSMKRKIKSDEILKNQSQNIQVCFLYTCCCSSSIVNSTQLLSNPFIIDILYAIAFENKKFPCLASFPEQITRFNFNDPGLSSTLT